MPKKRKRYMVTAENSEAFACSLVTEPAVEELFVAFNEEKPLIEKFADAKKHMLTGIVAIPNKPIFRRDTDGEEYDIVFSKEAIESMSKKFMKNFRQKNVTLQHQEDAEGIYMVEQWLKSDAEHDKSVALGFSKDIPVGTWFQSYYVDSNEVWDRVESGELRGFSLECALGVEEFEKQIFEEQTPAAPTVTETVETPVVEEPTPVVETPVVEEAPKSSIEDRLDKIWEVVQTMLPKEEPNEAIQEPQDEPKVEEPIVTPTEEEKPSEEPKIDINALNETIENLKSELEALKEKNHLLESEKEALSNKVDELGAKPSAKPLNTNGKGEGNGDVSNLSSWLDKMQDMMR